VSELSAPTPSLTLPVPRALLRLALPILASQGLRLAFQWVDALWVRALGTTATAAITTSVFVIWCVLSLNDVFGMGISAYVSQLIGAGERERAGVAAWKGIRASAAMGLLGTAAGLFGARAIFHLMDTSGAVVENGASYLRVVLAAAPLFLAAETCEGVLRAAGDTRTPLLVELGAVGFNAVLAPLLIYGLGPFPRLGVAGAAWATVGAHAVRLSCYATLAARRHPSFPLARRSSGPPVRVLGLARVGAPVALIGMLFSFVYMSFVRSASAYGAASVAVVGIGNRLEALQFVIALAMGLAGASVLGQSLGAGRPERATDVLRTNQRWALALSLVLTAVFLAIPRTLLAWFSPSPDVWSIGVPYLRVLSIALPFTALEIVTAESVMGSGHTTVLSWIYTLVSIARIPLAFLVPRWTHTGALGIAWLISLTCAARSLAILAWVARGTWKRGLAKELHGRASGAPPTSPDTGKGRIG
jgi:putative MATE family efflux protein